MAFAFAPRRMTTETRLIAALIAKSVERGRDGSDTTKGSAVRGPSRRAHEAQMNIPENCPHRKKECVATARASVGRLLSQLLAAGSADG